MGRTCEVVKITEAKCAGAKPGRGAHGEAVPKLYIDSAQQGFGLMVGKAGAKTFVVRGSIRGRDRRLKIGRWGTWTVDQARKRAKELQVDFDKGIDPIAERKRAAARGITLEDALLLKKQSLLAEGKAAKTLRNVEREIRLYLKSWLKRPLAEISREEVRKRHLAIAAEVKRGDYAQKIQHGARAGEKVAPRNRDGRNTANDVMRRFSAVYNRALRQHPELPASPVGNVDKFDVEPPRTAIPKESLPAWWDAIGKADNAVRRDYLRLLLFSGLRRESAAAIEWTDVDLDRAELFVREVKGGVRKQFTLPLSDYAVELLRTRKAGNEALAKAGALFADRAKRWAFPSNESESGHIVEVREATEGLRWTPHDLRRTYATVAESLDISPYAFKALLNHSQPGSGDVTGGYISITVERLRPAQQRITDELRRLVTGPAPVVPMPKRQQRRRAS